MTYKKIAELANVSLSTVSKALSGSREISDELRERVIKVAKDGGYFAEKGRRKLENSKDGAITVAIVCPELVSIAYAGEITALKEELEKRGAVAAVYVYDFDGEKLASIIDVITVGNRADGIIVIDGMNEIPCDRSIPIVVLGSKESDVDTVCCDIDDCIFDVVGHLVSLGHRDIAFVGEKYTESKLCAYKNALRRYELPINEENIYVISERFESIGYSAAEKMLGSGSMPTAVICAYDEIALGLIHSLSERGVCVPRDISIVGINDIPMAAYSSVPLTTVRFFEREQGRIAVELLYDKMFEKSRIIQHIRIDHELMIRRSTDKVRSEK